jgi:hypothetical protein
MASVMVEWLRRSAALAVRRMVCGLKAVLASDDTRVRGENIVGLEGVAERW